MTKHIANIVTGSRILGSILLLFLPAFSVEFFIIYLLCGFSDMIDGTIARKTSSAREFGSKLDTVADFTFVTASMIKILPRINIPQWLWIWGAVIASIKIGNIIWGYAAAKRFISLHSIMNKITGLLLFILPLTLRLVEPQYSFVLVCAVATLAATHEWVYVAVKCRNK